MKLSAVSDERLVILLLQGSTAPDVLLEYARRVGIKRRESRCIHGHDACALAAGGPCSAKAALRASAT